MFKPTHYMKKSRGIFEGFYLIPVIIERQIASTDEFFVRDANNNGFIANSSMLLDSNLVEKLFN